MTAATNFKFFSAEDAKRWFHPGKPCKIETTDESPLTSEKIQQVMQKVALFMNSQRGCKNSKEIRDAYETFSRFCENQKVKFSFAS